MDYSTLLYSRKKYFWKYFDSKDTIYKITLKINELSIPDIRARTLMIIFFYQRWDEKPRRAVLVSVLDEMVLLSLSAVNSHTFGCEVAH